MRVVRLLLVGLAVAVAIGFVARLLAPRRPVAASESGYQPPAPAEGPQVAVDAVALPTSTTG